MIKFFLTCIIALSLASVSLSARSCDDGEGKLVDDGVPIAISTK